MGDDVAHLADHRIGGEVAVDLLDLLEVADAVADAVEDALGGFEEGAGALLAGLALDLSFKSARSNLGSSKELGSGMSIAFIPGTCFLGSNP